MCAEKAQKENRTAPPTRKLETLFFTLRMIVIYTQPLKRTVRPQYVQPDPLLYTRHFAPHAHYIIPLLIARLESYTHMYKQAIRIEWF